MPTDPAKADSEHLARLEGHYHQALALTKGLLSEIRAHGKEIDLESLAHRLRDREKALHQAAQAARESFPKGLDLEGDGPEPLCTNIRRIAQETLELGEELTCILARVKEEAREELAGFEAGGKLMKGYKGFKARTALRLDRRA